MHETILGPGEISHPPHKHVHEEIIVIVEGTIEASVEGRLDRAGAGSVSYFATNEMHIPSNVPHRAIALEDTLDLDVFSPVRTDWLTKDDDYLRRGERESAA